MRRATVVLALTIAIAGCSGGKPDVAACERAMRADYQHALTNPTGPPASRPASCKGVDDATLNQLVAKILAGN